MEIKILTNYDNDELFCVYSKKRIKIGETYILKKEQLYDGEIIELTYKLEYAEIIADEQSEEE